MLDEVYATAGRWCKALFVAVLLVERTFEISVDCIFTERAVECYFVEMYDDIIISFSSERDASLVFMCGCVAVT